MTPSLSVGIRCKWKLKCPKKWEDLAPTVVSNVRHCDECSKHVTLVMSKMHLAELARAGECVAVVWGRRVEPTHIYFTRLGLPRTPGDKLRDFTDEV